MSCISDFYSIQMITASHRVQCSLVVGIYSLHLEITPLASSRPFVYNIICIYGHSWTFILIKLKYLYSYLRKQRKKKHNFYIVFSPYSCVFCSCFVSKNCKYTHMMHHHQPRALNPVTFTISLKDMKTHEEDNSHDKILSLWKYSTMMPHTKLEQDIGFWCCLKQ